MSTLCRLLSRFKRVPRPLSTNIDLCRTLLSEAYRCQNAWEERLKSPVLSKIAFSDYVINVYNKFEKDQCSFLDMDILANKISKDFHDTELRFIESVLRKYRKTPDGVKISPSITHGIVRGFTDAEMTDKLLEFLHNKIEFGLHLDPLIANILMDYFIRKEMYNEAAKIAFDIMLQEDYSNRISYLLSLYATTKLLYNPVEVEVQDEEEEAKQEEDEEEEEEVWEAVGIINYPYYDDHFSIQNPKFLHGKTLYMLGKELDNVNGRSLQIIGLGMYEKFSKALQIMERWMTELDSNVVTQDVITRFEDILLNAPTRDPDEPEIDFGLLRIEDEIRKLQLTPEEKEQCIEKWQELKGKLESENKISSDNLEQNIYDYVKSELPKYEQNDITELQSLIKSWEVTRCEVLDKQVADYMKQKKMEEIQEKLITLEEKEELLSYYTYQNEIRVLGMKAPKEHKEVEKVELDEDDIEEARLQRQLEMKKKKKRF